MLETRRIAQPTKRIRGGNLQRRNARLFMRNPLCVHCLLVGRATEASEWDHIIRLADGGADDESNLQGLCWECHQKKTKLENRG